jgi:outer membrane protein OmpA-like peptidoglycan-associated protein
MQKSIKVILLGSILVLSACQTAQENPNTAKGAGIGAAAGAVIGGIIGHQSGNREKGALLGAVLGGGAGGVIGKRMDKQQKELEKIAETKRTDQGLITKLKSDILFDSGKSDLKPAAKESINQLAVIIKKYPENILTIKGYTDDTGSSAINLPLSEQRAQSVRNQLVSAGVPANTTSSLGMGPNNPVDAAKTKEARSKNRRVEIEITVDESKVPKS